MKRSGIHPVHAMNRLHAVALMFESLPPVRDANEVEAMAKALEKFDANARRVWAERCGCPNATSDDTWELLVEMARGRKPITAGEIREFHRARRSAS